MKRILGFISGILFGYFSIMAISFHRGAIIKCIHPSDLFYWRLEALVVMPFVGFLFALNAKFCNKKFCLFFVFISILGVSLIEFLIPIYVRGYASCH
jgi:hypothetical protein